MATVLRMPGLSADAESAVLLDWLVVEGTSVSASDAVATVETEKANVDIEAGQDALLWRTLVVAGATVEVGRPIAILIKPGEQVEDEDALLAALGVSEPAGGPPARGAELDGPTTAPAPDEPGRSDIQRPRLFASPLARRIAREHDLALETLTGSGPGQRIVRADVMRAIARAAPDPTPTAEAQPPRPERADPLAPHSDRRTPLSPARRATARILTASKRDVPHFYLNVTCRADALLTLRAEINAAAEARLSINDFVIKAVARAFVEVPEMNVTWGEEYLQHHDSVDLGVAIGGEHGLVTPVLRSAELLSVRQISSSVRGYIATTASGRLHQADLEGGVLTITNLGMHGIESFGAIIKPPQVGILAVGAVVATPVVDGNTVGLAKTMNLTLSADHRAVDGVLAATWLQRVKHLLEHPLLAVV